MPQSLADPLTAWERAVVEMTGSSNLITDTLTGLVLSLTYWRLNSKQRDHSQVSFLSCPPSLRSSREWRKQSQRGSGELLCSSPCFSASR